MLTYIFRPLPVLYDSFNSFSKKMTISNVPIPSFIHFGIEGGTTSICPITFRNEPAILVGTFKGKCMVYSTLTNLLLGVVYEDPSNRHIVALGELQDESESSSFRKFWVHFRGDAVEIFKLVEEDSEKGTKFEKIRTISTGHYGFAKAFFDTKRQRMIIPDSMNTDNVIKLRYENGGETCFAISTEYLQKNLIKLSPDCQNMQISDLFKGVLMGIEPIEDPPHDRLLLGLEESILVFDLRMKKVVTCFKHAKFNNILTFRSSFYRSENLTRIVISVVGRLFSLIYQDETLKLDKLLKNTKKTEVDCNTLSFSPQGNLLACGYTNGRVEIYAVPEFTQCYTTLDYQETSIYSPNWICFEHRSENLQEEEKSSLCIGSEDGKLSLYNIG